MFRPYVDGGIGFNYFFIETTVEERERGYEEIMRDTNFYGFTFSYGVGAGMNLRVYQYSGFSDDRGTSSTAEIYLMRRSDI